MPTYTFEDGFSYQSDVPLTGDALDKIRSFPTAPGQKAGTVMSKSQTTSGILAKDASRLIEALPGAAWDAAKSAVQHPLSTAGGLLKGAVWEPIKDIATGEIVRRPYRAARGLGEPPQQPNESPAAYRARRIESMAGATLPSLAELPVAKLGLSGVEMAARAAAKRMGQRLAGSAATDLTEGIAAKAAEDAGAAAAPAPEWTPPAAKATPVTPQQTATGLTTSPVSHGRPPPPPPSPPMGPASALPPGPGGAGGIPGPLPPLARNLNPWAAKDPTMLGIERAGLLREGEKNVGNTKGALLGRAATHDIPEAHWPAINAYLEGRPPPFPRGTPRAAINQAYKLRGVYDYYRNLGDHMEFFDHGRENYLPLMLVDANGKTTQIVTDVQNRLAASLKSGKEASMFRGRLFDDMDALDRWLSDPAHNYAAQGVRVDRHPGRVIEKYVSGFHRAVAQRELASELASTVLPEGHNLVTSSDDIPAGLHPRYLPLQEGVPAFNRALAHVVQGGQAPGPSQVSVDLRYKQAVERLFAGPNRLTDSAFLHGVDNIQNLHRGFILGTRPWVHRLFNVGFDTLNAMGIFKGLSPAGGVNAIGLPKTVWGNARRWGAKAFADQDPWVMDNIRYGGSRAAVQGSPMEGMRRNLSSFLPAKGPMKGWIEGMEKFTWEDGVNGYMFGLNKMVWDQLEAGKPIRGLGRAVGPQEWNALSYPEKHATVGRIGALISGQMSRGMFKNPETISNLRYIMFSPSWNLSNLGVMQAAMGMDRSFAMRGLNDAQQKIVRNAMQQYITKSVGTYFLFSDLANMTTTGLFGDKGPQHLWQNPPGLRTRVWTPLEERTRAGERQHLYARSPLGFMWKELEPFSAGATGVAGSLYALATRGPDPGTPLTEAWDAIKQVGPSKLAWLGQLAEKGVARGQSIEGAPASLMFEILAEDAMSTVVPINVGRAQNPARLGMYTAGLPTKSAATPTQLLNLGKQKADAALRTGVQNAREGAPGEMPKYAQQFRNLLTHYADLARASARQPNRRRGTPPPPPPLPYVEEPEPSPAGALEQ